MPKLGLKATVTTTATVTTELKLAPKAKLMIRQRCAEYVQLSEEIKKSKERQERIKKEVEALYIKEKQGEALVAGTELDGFALKMVFGDTTTLNKTELMKTYGISAEEMAEFYDTKPKKPYLRLAKAGEKDHE